MKNAMRLLWGSNLDPFTLACAFIAALAISQAGADPEITPDQGRAPSAVMPEPPDDGSVEKRELKLDYSTVSPGLQIVLPPPSEEEKQSVAGVGSKGPAVIGFHRDLPDSFEGDLSPQLDWTEHSDGSFVTSLSVTTPEAESVRVGIRAELAPGGEIRFFRPHSDERFPVVSHEDFHIEDDEIETLWSPTVEGDTIGIEITLPSEKAVGVFSLTLETVAHSFLSTKSLPLAPKLDCPHLHIDVACRSSSIRDDLQNAVALIVYEDAGLTWVCSGTLLNDKVDGTDVPYFLTANHCVDTASVARTVEAHWFYQNALCNIDSVDRRYTTTRGTDLLTTNSPYDLSLLRMRGTLPGGLVLSGWDAASIDHPASVYGIHHPDGEVKSYSSGTTGGNYYSDGVTNAIEVEWSVGTTEGGSSGSGLFLRNGGYLVGGLSHGEYCGYRITDHFGPFRDFFPQARRWLDPGASPPTMDDDDHGDTTTTASIVRVPSSTRGSLERTGDVDYFQFTIGASGTIRVYTAGTTDTYGTLTRAASSFRREDDDGGAGTNFGIDVSGALIGSYFVQVRGFSTSVTGAYTLHVESSGALGSADHVLPLVTEASNLQRQGFVRLINNSNRLGTVVIHAVDDSGRRFGATSLTMDSKQSLNFNSQDLEQGNSSLGLFGGVGNGTGDWRVELRSDLDIAARAYIRTTDGFLTSMHQVAEEAGSGSMRYYIPFFNPASNTSLVSLLRIINSGPSSANVEITGVDAQGNSAPGGSVRLTLQGGGARLLSAQQLENGDSGLTGRLGQGQGKWQLHVSANRSLQVLGLMRTRSGHLSNLSR